MSDAVVLMAYGSPATADDIRPYFEDVRGGRPVSDEAVTELAERYRRIGGRSPLDEITEAQRVALERELGVARPAISYPFGASSPEIRRVARECGYELGFALAGRWDGDPMAVTRLPVYVWTTPTPGRGPLAWLERAGAVGANRCAVGTTLWQRWRAGVRAARRVDGAVEGA